MTAVNCTRATGAKFKIVGCFAINNVPAFFAFDCISSDFDHMNQSHKSSSVFAEIIVW